jgi:ribonuclease E
VIKRNQIVLVQVIKEERGNKGVSLTTYISLAGRYCVLMPNSPKAGGVSRKIANGEQRRKLKEMVAELRESRGLSAIIRTAGIDRTRAEVKRDYEYLVKLWQQIREDTLASTAPNLIYEESDIIKRAIRDLYTNDIEQVLVQGENAYKDAKTFMKLIMPSHAPRVKQYKDNLPIFSSYGIEEQLDSMYEATAKLPSGGYIVLHPTEALISIDVNSGRSTTERNVEETAIKTNLEAAREIARQLRLRDLAGLVVIDFIDMYYGRNRRTLEKAMKDALKHDRAKIQMSRISAFGLMELSRQRLRPSIAESSSVMCPHCEGTGSVRSVETVAIQIIRLLEREAVSGDYTELKIFAGSEVVLHMFNHKRDMIRVIEDHYQVRIVLQIDTHLLSGRFRLVKVTAEGKEIAHDDEKDRGARRKGRRGRRGGRNRREGGPNQPEQSRESHDDDAVDDDNDTDVEIEADDEEQNDNHQGKRRHKIVDDEDEEGASDSASSSEEDEETTSEAPRRRGGRGGRGRNRNRDRNNRDRDNSERPQHQSQRQQSHSTANDNESGEESGIVTADNDNEPEIHTPAPIAVAASRPKPAEPSIPEGVIIDSLTKSVIGESPDKPKRRGWWNRSE